jgi:hypothetical protein
MKDSKCNIGLNPLSPIRKGAGHKEIKSRKGGGPR